jgi:hypothetical protein
MTIVVLNDSISPASMRSRMLGVTTHEPSLTPVTVPSRSRTSMNPRCDVDSE